MKKYTGCLIILILAALALRLYNLTYHSFWFDEAISVYWARQTVPRILEVGFTLVEDRLPPLYYLLLKAWITVFGSGEAAIRALSVVFGVLLVPVSTSVARLLFGRRVALIAATLVTLNPFLIWYAQEARMYAPAVFFGSLMVWAFLNLCLERKNCGYPLKFIVVFILVGAAGLYSHLYTAFLLPALGLWLLISYPHRRQLWLIFMAATLIILLIFSPIALATWRFSAEAPPGAPFTGLLDRAWELLQAFTVWKAPLTPLLQRLLPLLVVLLALCAFLPLPSRDRQTILRGKPQARQEYCGSRLRQPRLLVALLCSMPFMIANLLLFRNQLAFFGERYFITIIPWLLLLASLGTDRLSAWLSSLILHFFGISTPTHSTSHLPPPTSHLTFHASRFTFYALRFTFYILPITVCTFLLLPLPGQWSPPAAKEAWRQSVAYLAQQATADDAILIHPDWVRYPFQYYFKGPGQTYAAFSTVTSETALDGPLQGVVGGHPVVWLIQSHLEAPDPDRRVEQWLASRYPLITELYPPGITLKGYAPGYQLETVPPAATPVDIHFDNGLQLVGYEADRTVSATDELFHPPSGWVHVTLYWTAAQPVAAKDPPFIQLVGPAGVWGVSLDRPSDTLKLYPPSRWQPGQIIRHDLDVNLNPLTPPGTYQLMLGLSGQATQYPLGQVEVR